MVPQLSAPLVLGIQWLQSVYPVIDWYNRTIFGEQEGHSVSV